MQSLGSMQSWCFVVSFFFYFVLGTNVQWNQWAAFFLPVISLSSLTLANPPDHQQSEEAIEKAQLNNL